MPDTFDPLTEFLLAMAESPPHDVPGDAVGRFVATMEAMARSSDIVDERRRLCAALAETIHAAQAGGHPELAELVMIGCLAQIMGESHALRRQVRRWVDRRRDECEMAMRILCGAAGA